MMGRARWCVQKRTHPTTVAVIAAVDKITNDAQSSEQTGTSVDSETSSKRNDKDQEALVDLAQEAKQKGGVTNDEAQTLLNWGKEYNVPVRGIESHPNRNFDVPHIHIGPVDHIPVLTR